MRRLPDTPTLRAALWARFSLGSVRRHLRRNGVRAMPELPAPPTVPRQAVRGVYAVLRRTQHSCLERALVLQRWFEATGDPRDVVIGVSGPSEHFQAHAWLDGDDGDGEAFHELTRIPPRAAS